jgi:glycosyltransferase involved in cell wall biosynthesis
MIKYSIFVPCYNEEKAIVNCIEKIANTLPKNMLKETEIIVVNDCSTDKTLEKIKEVIKKGIITLRYTSYVGFRPTRRENLINSFKYARGEIIAFTDADLSTDVSRLALLLICARRYGICIGNRYHPDSKITRSTKRYLISKLINGLTRMLFLTGIQDHFIGFKAFRKDKLMKIVEKTRTNKKYRSMWWDAEALIEAQRLGYFIATIPVTWTESKWTKLNFKRELGILYYMIKKRIELWTH